MKLLNELQLVSKKYNEVDDNEFSDSDFTRSEEGGDDELSSLDALLASLGLDDEFSDSDFTDSESDDEFTDADFISSKDEDEFSFDGDSDEFNPDEEDEFSELDGLGDFSAEDDLEDEEFDDEFGTDEESEDLDKEGDEFEFDDSVDTGEFDPNDQDFQGEIRTVKGANLVYKRETKEGNFEELWIYNTGKDIKKETEIRRAILAGTDIDPSSKESEDGTQTVEVGTVGNVQFLHINGLPN